MTDYAIPADDPSLYPDDGEYAIVQMDTWKPPDDAEFMMKLREFDDAESVILPPNTPGCTYYVYAADGEDYSREAWEEKVESDS